MIKIIKNGTIITMDSNRNIINGDIIIENDEIVGITKNCSLECDYEIDASGLIVMPGLINTHNHLGMSIFRGTNDGLDLMNWLNNKIFPIEDKMTDEDMYYATLITAIEMIKTGTTCSADMYFGWKKTIKALEETKIRCLFSRGINDPDGNYDNRVNDFLELIKYCEEKNNPLISLSVAPHSLYTCSKECLIKCKELADSYNLPIQIHFCENKEEVEIIRKKYGMAPIKVLESLGYLENKLILAHGIYMESVNLHLLKRDNIYIAHNIISNLNLGCGIFPYKKYKDMGLNISLGTDGQGSGLNVNMFNTMSVTSLVSKGITEDALATSSMEILESATINGANALGLGNLVGSIEKGKKADLVILDLNNIEGLPNNNLINKIVHNVTPENIRYTIINGEVVMKDRKLLLPINEKEIKEKIYEITKRLF